MPGGHPALDRRASAYLHAVLNKDKTTAEELVLSMIGEGASLADVYAVLGSAQVEVGRLWEKGSITVSDEHYSTEVTLGCISLAAEKLRRFRREPMAFAYLSTAEGEFHSLGIRMLAELLRNEGWETELHTSGPLPSSLKGLMARRRVDLLCISATMPASAASVAVAIGAIRREQALQRLKIVAGGPAFDDAAARKRLEGGNGQAVLADRVAMSIPEAVEFARSVLAEKRAS